MNNLIYPLLLSTLAGLSTVVGAFIIFFKVKNIDTFISFCLSFSLSIMISLSLFELLPESIIDIFSSTNNRVGIILILISFLSGFCIIKGINQKMNNYSNNLYKLGLMSALALMIHNFPEGIATFMSSYNNLTEGIGLTLAIMMHNIPEGISIAIPLFYSGKGKGKSILVTLASGLAEPLGAIIAYIILHRVINNITISIILIFVSGIMISLAIEEIYPEVIKYNKKTPTYLGLISGVVITLINIFIL